MRVGVEQARQQRPAADVDGRVGVSGFQQHPAGVGSRIIGEVIGQEVEYDDCDPDAYQEAIRPYHRNQWHSDAVAYLFAEIARRVKAFSEANPSAPIIRLGIGDVTEPLPEACRNAMKAAIENVALVGETAFVHMGAVTSADHLVIVADFLMKLAEATWSVVSGIRNGKLVVIFRNAGFRRDAGRRARETLGDLGPAGGHKSAARAEIPLAAIQDIAGATVDYGAFVRRRLKKSVP